MTRVRIESTDDAHRAFVGPRLVGVYMRHATAVTAAHAYMREYTESAAPARNNTHTNPLPTTRGPAPRATDESE